MNDDMTTIASKEADEPAQGLQIDAPDRWESRDLRRTAVRGGTMVVASRLFVQAFSSLAMILVARFLRPYDYGISTLGTVVYQWGEIFAEAGVGRALVQRASLSDRDAAEAFTLSLSLSALMYALLFVAAAPIAAFMQSPEMAAFIRVIGLGYFLIPLRSVPMGLLDRRLQMGRQSLLGIGVSLVQGSVLVGLAATGCGYWSFAVAYVLANLLSVSILARLTNWRPALRRPRTGISSILMFGLHLSGARVCLLLYSNADYAVLGRMLGPVELGYYSLAFMVTSIPLQRLVSNFNQVAYPVFCRMRHDEHRMRNWFLRLTTLIAAVGTPALIGIALVAEDAVPLILGAKWGSAVPLLQTMCVAGVFMMLGGTFDMLFNALGRPDILLRYYLICLIVYPASFWLGGYYLGAPGIALAWSVITPALVSFLIVLTRPITGFGLLEFYRGQFPIWVASFLMSLAVLEVEWILGGPSLQVLRLMLSIVAGVAAYGLAIRLMAWDLVADSMRVILKEYRRQ